VERSLRIKVHQEYFNAILFRDLIERHDIAHPRAVIDLAHYLVDNTGALYSINNLVGYLKSLGHKVMKTSVTNYLEWFEDAYIFFTVRLFDPSHTRAHANPKKIYCIDHALVNSVGSGILVNSGHLLENLVFMTLRRISTKIYYYRSKKGHEVDFIFKKPDQTKVLIQVCETLLDPQTRKRELLALNEAMEEQNVSSAIIVTRREEDELSSELGQIRIIPIWKFCLFIEKNH
jgi:predicted AAA+ superfamily ATPase